MSQISGRSESVLLDSVEDAGRSTGIRMLGDYLEMTKPRIAVFVVITALIGYAMAVRALPDVSAQWVSVLAALFGTALTCMGSCALNHAVERDTDALMLRTRNRPVASGRISPGRALVFGSALGAAGVGILWAGAGALAAGLSLFTILSYVWLYTPLKRTTSASTVVGAVPGALPPVIGYAAASGRIQIEALVLFGIMFIWQLPHFFAIAWLYRDEYAKAGLPVLAVVDPEGGSTFRQILLGCAALGPMGLAPAIVGMSGGLYVAGALLSAAAMMGFGAALAIGRTNQHARRLFLVSLVYLPLVFALMVIDSGP